MVSGWYKDSHRHYLAAKGIKSTVKPHYFALKEDDMMDMSDEPRHLAKSTSKRPTGGNGGRLLQSAFSLGSDKFSIAGAERHGEGLLSPVIKAGEEAQPTAYEKGKEMTPDVKHEAAEAEERAEMSGEKLMGDQFMAKKASKSPYTEETAPYYDEAPGMTPDEVWAFEERTGRRHKGEPLSEYLKKSAGIDEDKAYMAHKPAWKLTWTERVGVAATENGVNFVERSVKNKK